MTKFEVGDRVKAIGPSKFGFTENIGQIGKIVKKRSENSFDVDWDNGHGNTMPSCSMEHATKPPATRILFEKILVNGIKSRKITGFEGILGKDELPKECLNGHPSFYVDGGYLSVFYPKECTCGRGVSVCSGGVMSEPEYQEMLTWMGRAGSRLAKIRREERVAWSGSGADEI